MSPLPRGWSLATLNDLQADEARAITDGPFGSNLTSAHYSDTGARVIRLQNVGDGVFLDSEAYVPMAHFEKLKAHEARAGDLIVASLGEVLPKACLVPATLGPAIVKADCIRVRLGANVDPLWALYAMQTPDVRKWAGEQLHGVGRPRLGLKVIRQLPIPLPPIKEQRRIVHILEDHLSRLDAATNGLRVSRRRLASLREVQLHVLFSDTRGRRTKLGEIARWGSGGTPRSGSEVYYSGGTIPWVVSGELKDSPLAGSAVCITEAGLNESSAKWVPEGSVLVAMYGATIGKLATTLAPVTTNQAVAHAVPNSGTVTLDYLYWFLRSQRRDLVSAGQGGAQPNISQTVLKDWPIVLPDLNAQRQVVSSAREVQELVARMESEVEAAEERAGGLRHALLAAAFTGALSSSHGTPNV